MSKLIDVMARADVDYFWREGWVPVRQIREASRCYLSVH
jgi:hypothetical protein